MTEDEMVGWHHQLNGHESEQSPGSQRVGHDLATEQPPPQFKSINSFTLNFLYGPTLTSIHDYLKTIALPRR